MASWNRRSALDAKLSGLLSDSARLTHKAERMEQRLGKLEHKIGLLTEKVDFIGEKVIVALRNAKNENMQ